MVNKITNHTKHADLVYRIHCVFNLPMGTSGALSWLSIKELEAIKIVAPSWLTNGGTLPSLIDAFKHVIPLTHGTSKEGAIAIKKIVELLNNKYNR